MILAEDIRSRTKVRNWEDIEVDLCRFIVSIFHLPFRNSDIDSSGQLPERKIRLVQKMIEEMREESQFVYEDRNRDSASRFQYGA